MKKAAIIIGQSQRGSSEFRELAGVENDLAEVYAFLRQTARYELVHLLRDKPKAEVLGVLHQTLAQLSAADRLVIYFSGHGHGINGEHVLICQGATRSELRWFHEAIPVNQLRSMTEGRGLDRSVVIDSCWDSPYAAAHRGGPEPMTAVEANYLRDIGTAPVQPGAGGVVGSFALLCACSEDQVAVEVPALRRGLFTAAWMDLMGDAARGGRMVRMSSQLAGDIAQRMRMIAAEYRLPVVPEPLYSGRGDPILLEGNLEESPARAAIGAVAAPPPLPPLSPRPQAHRLAPPLVASPAPAPPPPLQAAAPVQVASAYAAAVPLPPPAYTPPVRRPPLAYATPAARPLSNVRWFILALLFAATTVNYIDRMVISVLKPTLSHQFHWSETNYGDIIFSFQLAYAIGLVAAGYALDRLGERRGLALAVGLWSLAALAHGLLGNLRSGGGLLWFGGASVAAFAGVRFLLGLAEAANFPASIKTVAEWFPVRQRATATGLFNSGSNLGALLTPLLAAWVAIKFGWPVAFYVTGLLGFAWLVVWLVTYRRPEVHPRVSPSELAFIRSDTERTEGEKERRGDGEMARGDAPATEQVAIPPPPSSLGPHPYDTVRIMGVRSLLGQSQTWMFSLGKFLTDPIWWFYLFWIPDFLARRHGLNLLAMGPPLVTIYLMADAGSIGGGWLSSSMLKHGWSVNAARKTAMLVCALCVVPVFFASLVASTLVATLLIGLAAAGHQGFSANLFTLVSDTVPRKSVSSVVGIGGTAGAIGGMCIAKLAGYVLDTTHSFLPLFAIASLAYLVALLLIHLISPRLAPMQLEAA